MTLIFRKLFNYVFDINFNNYRLVFDLPNKMYWVELSISIEKAKSTAKNYKSLTSMIIDVTLHAWLIFFFNTETLLHRSFKEPANHLQHPQGTGWYQLEPDISWCFHHPDPGQRCSGRRFSYTGKHTKSWSQIKVLSI